MRVQCAYESICGEFMYHKRICATVKSKRLRVLSGLTPRKRERDLPEELSASVGCEVRVNLWLLAHSTLELLLFFNDVSDQDARANTSARPLFFDTHTQREAEIFEIHLGRVRTRAGCMFISWERTPSTRRAHHHCSFVCVCIRVCSTVSSSACTAIANARAKMLALRTVERERSARIL